MFSVGLVWGALIVLPGLVFHLTLFAKSDHSVEVNHTTNPVAYVISISLGSILAHAGLSALLVINDLIVAICGILINAEVDVYSFSANGLNSEKILILCGALGLICAIAYGFARLLNTHPKISEFIIDLKYGPFSQFYKKTAGADTMWLAHVLTKTQRATQKYSQHLAYIGRLEKLVTQSGSITEIHLADANPFFIKMTANQFSTNILEIDEGLQRLGTKLEYICISDAEILNVAFLSYTPNPETLEAFEDEIANA